MRMAINIINIIINIPSYGEHSSDDFEIVFKEFCD